MKGGWGIVPEAGFGTDPARDLRIARTLREAVGADVTLALDVSAIAGWTPPHATRMAEQLREVNLGWLEDALHHDDHEGYRRIRAAVPTPLATGERCWTPNDYRRLVRSGSVDLVLIDPGRVEGISGVKTIADEAASDGVRWVPHSWSSAINTAAALHVFAATANGHVFELKPNPTPMQHELVSDPFEQRDGYIEVRDAPGLGITVDEDVVRQYALT
jgi:L-alanine-DL-glutamate epimerase-like enolase superfamily enzyme